MKKLKTIDLVYMAFYIALAIALEYVSKMIPFEMPYGGKMELHVIALFIASFHLGWIKGSFIAILIFVTETILGLNSWLYYPTQIALDYIIPLLACGICSIFPKVSKSNLFSGMIVAMLIKYLSHVLVGVYYWFPEGEAAGSLASWTYSMTYNLWYNLATLVASLILVPLLLQGIKKSRTIRFAGLKE